MSLARSRLDVGVDPQSSADNLLDGDEIIMRVDIDSGSIFTYHHTDWVRTPPTDGQRQRASQFRPVTPCPSSSDPGHVFFEGTQTDRPLDPEALWHDGSRHFGHDTTALEPGWVDRRNVRIPSLREQAHRRLG